MKKWFIGAIILKLIVIGFTYHPDTHFFVLANYITVNRGDFMGFYDFLGQNSDPVANVLPAYAFTYPPLAILTNSITAMPFYLTLGNDFIREFLLNPESVMGSFGYFWLIYGTKIGYLIPDLIIANLLGKLFTGKKSKNAMLLWLFNPITLYSAYGIGAFDLFPVMFVILAYYFYLKNSVNKSALMLGIGGAFKLFPLLLLPMLIVDKSTKFKEKVTLTIVGLAGYLVPILPYLLTSPGFRTYALIAPQTDKMLFAKIPVSGAEYLSLFIFILGLMIVLFRNSGKLLPSWIGVLMSFFAVTHYHPQWMVWVVPLAIITIIKIPEFKFYYGLLGLCYLVIVLSFDSSLNYGLFLPFHNWPSLVNFVPPQFELFKYLSMVRSIAAGVTAFVIYKLFTSLTPEKSS